MGLDLLLHEMRVVTWLSDRHYVPIPVIEVPVGTRLRAVSFRCENEQAKSWWRAGGEARICAPFDGMESLVSQISIPINSCPNVIQLVGEPFISRITLHTRKWHFEAAWSVWVDRVT